MKKIMTVLVLFILSLALSGCYLIKETSENNAQTNYVSVQNAGNNTIAETTQEIESSQNTIATQNTEKQQSVDNISDSQNLGSDETNTEIKLLKISRNASGLDNVAELDFNKFLLNNRISDILNDLNIYNDVDYKNGLIKEADGLLISERFSENIIQDIKIGTSYESVKSILGNPSFSLKDYSFYNTKQYYLGFRGKERVEQAIIRNNPKKYNPQILAMILQNLNREDYSDLQSIIIDNQEIYNFFELKGHIEGGGWYANSYNGITLQEFADDNNVTVYNNFEGDLFSYKGQLNNYKVIFKNEDNIVNEQSQDVSDYINLNKKFETEGTLSPSGKLKCIYDWIYAMSQYFTIRTIDNSRPDFRLPAASTEFKWINDNYILFIHDYYNIPYIVKVSDRYEEPLNVFYKLGIALESDPGTMDDDYDVTIKEVTDNLIILEDRGTKKIYAISYSFDNDGLINLSISN